MKGQLLEAFDIIENEVYIARYYINDKKKYDYYTTVHKRNTFIYNDLKELIATYQQNYLDIDEIDDLKNYRKWVNSTIEKYERKKKIMNIINEN